MWRDKRGPASQEGLRENLGLTGPAGKAWPCGPVALVSRLPAGADAPVQTRVIHELSVL